MTVCVVCDVLGRANNGTTIAALNLIGSLRKKGHTVRVVCPDAERAGEPDTWILPTIPLGPFRSYVKKNGVVIARPSKRVLEAALDGADHVHVMTPLPAGCAAIRLAKRMGLSATAGFHCQAENITSHLFLKNCGPANRLAYRMLYRGCYRYADAIHYPTQFIRDVFEQCVGPTNGRVISNGVNRQFHPAPAERPEEWNGRDVILFIGRYSREKTHHVLIDAAKRSAHADRIQLVFAGDGPLKEKLRKQSEGLAHPPVFRFFSREELVRVINCADLYVHPAEIEIEAIACLEAISCGLVPVISDSPRSATRAFAPDERNLFPCNDSASLAKRIDYWLDHPAEKEACRQACLKAAGNYDFETCMDRMEQMIRETHGEKRGV